MNHLTIILIIFSAAWLSLSLSLFLEFSKERMQLSALLFPHSDDFRESCIPQILVTEICETDINMYTCCCPSQACLNLLFFGGETQLCIHALQLSHPNLLVSSSSCCSSLCFSSPSVTILLIILNTLACTPLTEGHHDMRLNSNINCQIVILNYYTQTSFFDGSV